MSKQYTWRGPDLNLPYPELPEAGAGEFAAHVRAGAPVVIVEADEDEGALVAFPPAPFCWRLPRALWEHVHDENQPEPGKTAAWDGNLTPDLLLQMLAHPNAVQVVTALVEQRKDEAKAAVMPLLSPLMAALVPPEQLPMVQAMIKQFVK